MIGAGILNQPFCFYKSGILGAFSGFVLGIFGTWTGLLLMTEAGMSNNVLEFSDLAKLAMGTFGDKLVDFSVIFLAIGCMLGYIIVIGQTSSQVLGDWGCSDSVCSQFNVTIVIVTVIILPVCLLRTFGHLVPLAVFSVLAIVVCLFLVLIGGPIVTAHNDKAPLIWFDLQGTVISVGSIVLSLNCAFANFHAYDGVEDKSKSVKSWTRITGGAVAVGALMLMTMGIAGYLSFRDETDGEILNNFEGQQFDFFKAMIVIHLTLYIPVTFVICRFSMVKQCCGGRSEEMPWWRHFLVTVALLGSMTIVVLALVTQGMAGGTAFALITDIAGGVSGSLLTFVIPSLVYLRLMPALSETDRRQIADEATMSESLLSPTKRSTSRRRSNEELKFEAGDGLLDENDVFSNGADPKKAIINMEEVNDPTRRKWMRRAAWVNLVLGVLVLVTVVTVSVYSAFTGFV